MVISGDCQQLTNYILRRGGNNFMLNNRDFVKSEMSSLSRHQKDYLITISLKFLGILRHRIKTNFLNENLTNEKKFRVPATSC